MQKSVCSLLCLLIIGSVSAPLAAQLTVDLSVDVTEVGGIYTYEYTASNSILSSVGMNIIFWSVGKGAAISSVTGPDGWTSGYESTEMNLQVFSITGDGVTTNDDVNITPGGEGRFIVQSTWQPGEEEYFLGNLIGDDFLAFAEGMVLAPSIAPEGGIIFAACDFDEDGDCDLMDIDLLGQVIADGQNDAGFDLTNDQLVNIDDLNAFLEDERVNKLNGDLDFNGSVQFADFLVLSNNFGKDETFLWGGGDLVPNGKVEFPDFLIMSNNFGKSIEDVANAVPEPTSGLLMLSCALLLTLKRRRRSCFV